MQDPVDGDLLTVGDGNQGVYRRGKVSWKALGIQAKGRTVSARFNLHVNYRNSREVATLAQAFSASLPGTRLSDDEDGMSALPLDLAHCPRTTGQKPLLVRASSREAECTRAVAMVEDLLAGR